MGQDEGGAGDGADLAGADSDVLKGAPSAGEQREPAFAQGTLDGVAGAGIDVEFAAACHRPQWVKRYPLVPRAVFGSPTRHGARSTSTMRAR